MSQKHIEERKARKVAGAITAVPLPVFADNGDMMTFTEWVEAVACGMFVDDDGYGIWSDGTFVRDYNASNLTPDEELIEDFLYFGSGLEPTHIPTAMHDRGVVPSYLVNGCLWRPAWATHVLWFNR